MVALADLLVQLAESDIITTQLNLLLIGNFPVTSWQSGSVPLTLVQADAHVLASLSKNIANIAAGGLLDTAASLVQADGTNPWLDLLGQSHYGLTRKPAVATQGNITLTDAQGAGPFTITPYQLFAASTGGLLYQNTAGGTLPKNGTLTLNWIAQSPGIAYNASPSTITTLSTPLPGVTVNNPDLNWITTPGSNAELDSSYITRCKARWPGLGGGATAAVYQSVALGASSSVTRVKVLENTPTGGQVTVYCAGPSGGSSSADLTTVLAAINAMRPLCVTVNVLAAVNVVVSIVGTVKVSQSYLASTQSAFLTKALPAYNNNLPVGGNVIGTAQGIVPVNKLVELIMDQPGVQNVALSLPVADITLQNNQVAVFDTSGLTWVGV